MITRNSVFAIGITHCIIITLLGLYHPTLSIMGPRTYLWPRCRDRRLLSESPGEPGFRVFNGRVDCGAIWHCETCRDSNRPPAAVFRTSASSTAVPLPDPLHVQISIRCIDPPFTACYSARPVESVSSIRKRRNENCGYNSGISISDSINNINSSNSTSSSTSSSSSSSSSNSNGSSGSIDAQLRNMGIKRARLHYNESPPPDAMIGAWELASSGLVLLYLVAIGES